MGRRRLDIMLEYLADLENDTENVVNATNEAWKQMINAKKYVLQIACDVSECTKAFGGAMDKPWNDYFPNVKTPNSFKYV